MRAIKSISIDSTVLVKVAEYIRDNAFASESKAFQFLIMEGLRKNGYPIEDEKEKM